ncbi:LemA family protein [Acetobacterium carbinolicum]|jgi:LemA protein|uniref:LemA family protein n=1 Tax=Acetobacterium TaxID=33951 RepID=UPI000DBEBA33|nr:MULTISPECIES: LemA family protein [unclassified Acetobacterium]AWW26001.1 LemA family protein [Acetobacterium sp. KB-1]MDZ5723516.1 LemA family protein [Acetobacterium sp. K1/6]
MIAIPIILGLIVIIGLWLILSRNSFVSIKNQVEEAFSTMDVYLKKRYDLIPNLVETVKGYATHESETFTKVTAARTAAMNSTSIDEKIANENALSGTLKSLFAVAEAYPQLQANTNFLDLQQQLKMLEDEIANSRKYYNAVVRTMNTKVESFPSNLVASMFGFKKQPFFEVGSAEERENVQVKFN